MPKPPLDRRKRTSARSALERTAMFTGKTVAGKYRIKAVVGSDFAGTLYKAEDIVAGRETGVKVLKPGFMLSSDVVKMLDHPNINKLSRVLEEEDGTTAVIMEVPPGASVKTILSKGEKITPGEAVSAAIQILSALHEVHAKRIVVQNLCSESIYFANDPSGALAVKVANISIGDRRQLPDKPFFLAPEVILGGADPDKRSDIWSVGVLLFEMLFGKRPFGGRNQDELVGNILLRDPRFPKRASEIPKGLVAVIEKALEKEPEDRYPNATTMIGDLLPLQEDLEETLGEEIETILKRSLVPPPKAVPASRAKAKTKTKTQALGKPSPGLRPPTRPGGDVVKPAAAAVKPAKPPVLRPGGDVVKPAAATKTKTQALGKPSSGLRPPTRPGGDVVKPAAAAVKPAKPPVSRPGRDVVKKPAVAAAKPAKQPRSAQPKSAARTMLGVHAPVSNRDRTPLSKIKLKKSLAPATVKKEVPKTKRAVPSKKNTVGSPIVHHGKPRGADLPKKPRAKTAALRSLEKTPTVDAAKGRPLPQPVLHVVKADTEDKELIAANLAASGEASPGDSKKIRDQARKKIPVSPALQVESAVDKGEELSSTDEVFAANAVNMEGTGEPSAPVRSGAQADGPGLFQPDRPRRRFAAGWLVKGRETALMAWVALASTWSVLRTSFKPQVLNGLRKSKAWWAVGMGKTVTVASKTGLWVSRNRRPVSIVGGVAALLLFILSVVSFLPDSQPPSPNVEQAAVISKSRPAADPAAPLVPAREAVVEYEVPASDEQAAVISKPEPAVDPEPDSAADSEPDPAVDPAVPAVLAREPLAEDEALASDDPVDSAEENEGKAKESSRTAQRKSSRKKLAKNKGAKKRKTGRWKRRGKRKRSTRKTSKPKPNRGRLASNPFGD